MKEMKTVKEISEQFGVTTMGVRYWINRGLKHKMEKVVGRKERIIINPVDVDSFLNLGIRKSK
tara:strand:+ start:162 stop:350 length:189 start_codon:yes stop_codon:yes gene_type:complete